MDLVHGAPPPPEGPLSTVNSGKWCFNETPQHLHAHPLNSFSEVLHWQLPGGYCCPLPRKPRLSDQCGHRKVLVIHDMMGGYIEDQNPQGRAGLSYSFRYWHLIDQFCYFSHHLVSIPPPCYIETCHANGVECLGTFLLEWEAGAEMAKMWLNACPLAAEIMAQQLNFIAREYGFDGFLINIECQLSSHDALALIRFLRELTKSCRVIFYDSITLDGRLQYQNQLNGWNVSFFDATDGICLNYGWKPDDVAKSAKFAEGRLGKSTADVYIGIDVHGRGQFGGGGLQSNVGTRVAAQANCSIALFAPAWTYESTDIFSMFNEKDHAFWSLLEPDLGPPRRLVQAIPFFTTFCTGTGPSFWIRGQIAANGQFTQHRNQSIQPIHPKYVTDLISFDGGSSLHVQGNSTLFLFSGESEFCSEIEYVYRGDPSLRLGLVSVDGQTVWVHGHGRDAGGGWRRVLRPIQHEISIYEICVSIADKGVAYLGQIALRGRVTSVSQLELQMDSHGNFIRLFWDDCPNTRHWEVFSNGVYVARVFDPQWWVSKDVLTQSHVEFSVQGVDHQGIPGSIAYLMYK